MEKMIGILLLGLFLALLLFLAYIFYGKWSIKPVF